MRRKKRRKRKAADFTDAKRQYLEFGQVFFGDDPGYGLRRGEVTPEVLADADDFGPDIVAEQIASRPGQRPWCWWVKHLGVSPGQRFPPCPSTVDGVSPLEYLAQNHLLSTVEKRQLFTRRMESSP